MVKHLLRVQQVLDAFKDSGGEVKLRGKAEGGINGLGGNTT